MESKLDADFTGQVGLRIALQGFLSYSLITHSTAWPLCTQRKIWVEDSCHSESTSTPIKHVGAVCSLSREALFPVATAASSPQSILQFSMTSFGPQLHNPEEKKKREKSRPLQLWMLLNQTSIRAFSEVHLGRLMAAAAPPRLWGQSLDRNHHPFQSKNIICTPKQKALPSFHSCPSLETPS